MASSDTSILHTLCNGCKGGGVYQFCLTLRRCHATMIDMSSTQTIHPGLAVILFNGERVGYVERAGDGTWHAMELHAAAFGHAADRFARASTQGATRREAVESYLAPVLAGISRFNGNGCLVGA